VGRIQGVGGQEFKRRLLAEPSQTLASLGYAGMQAEHTVVENPPKLHNMVVCTLCSCYPCPCSAFRLFGTNRDLTARAL
jgi:Nitrile hydratase, alpha chain